ncbi:MAG: GAF domain-containing protein [Solirubrobacteraceae bacterium]
MSDAAPGFGQTVAAGIIGADDAYHALLQSIVDVAQRIFAAGATSILIYDPDAHELIFEAAAGGAAGTSLIGQRVSAGSGIMGWVLSSHEPMIIEDVTRDPRFDRAGAERLGYVPKHMMSAPLLHDDEAFGVLNVLDRRERSFSGVEEMDLLGSFASQATIAISVLRAGRRAKRMLEDGTGDGALVAAIATKLDALDGPRRAAAMALLEALDTLIPG